MPIERYRAHHDSQTLDRRPWLSPLALIVLLLLLLLAPALSHAQSGLDSLQMHWTAPGDNGTQGAANGYEMYMSTAPITAANFAQAALVPGLPRPAAAGTRQTVIVRGLLPASSYWFAMRARDAAGNWSPLSNVLRWDTPFDASAPAAPSGVSGLVESVSKAVHVTWAANSEPDLAGYHVYRALSAGGPWIRLDPSPVRGTAFDDTQPPENGGATVWYSVTALDTHGNESGRSAAVTVALGSTGATSIANWSLAAPYPNPHHIGGSARLPLQVPADAGPARIEILDDTGRLVRRIAITARAGSRTEIVWDGANDAGQACAPGVYRAWLMAGSTRQVVRIARVP